MPDTITCGEATLRLLARYGVDTVFGIPGVHTLDFCRGLADSTITHVQARNEQGAGFMADGYARVSGKPGVALVISGPGVTNALTAVGQSWADSVPVLLLSAETATPTHGRGWGVLHEIPDQSAVTAPLTAMSARARRPEEIPDLIHRAFSIFVSERPRPVHISVPIDIQAMEVMDSWLPQPLPTRPLPRSEDIEMAADLLRSSSRPLLMVGGGATGAAHSIGELVDTLDAPVVASTAGKGILPDDHPLSLSAGTMRAEVTDYLGKADVVVAIGTELAETDSFVDRLPLPESLIRIDIDPSKLDDLYPSTVGIAADAAPATAALVDALAGFESRVEREAVAAELAGVRREVERNTTNSEQQHLRLLRGLRQTLDDDVMVMGDICQLVYTGAFGFDARAPRTWHYPAGFCTLGCALPNSIGAKMAYPDRDVLCLAGDGGVMFTIQELMTAAELGLPIPILIWDNGGLKQIQDDMNARGIPLVGVEGPNPDFVALALAMRCHGVAATSLEHVASAVLGAFEADRPTVIIVSEGDSWLR